VLGYSGGGTATEWAAELAPSYAPDLSANLVAAAQGGVLVDPAHSMNYVDGSSLWSGVMPMAIVGISRAFGMDFTPYLSDYGKQIMARMQATSVITVFGEYPGLSWSQMALPEYPTPESVPGYASMVNKLIMGTGGTPQIPMLFDDATNGYGDLMTITGDVRTLARQYCAAGVQVDYHEDNLSPTDGWIHLEEATPWWFQAIPWLMDRMNGKPAPSNCASIPPGTPLTPLPS
jgi:hypothetical protein